MSFLASSTPLGFELNVPVIRSCAEDTGPSSSEPECSTVEPQHHSNIRTHEGSRIIRSNTNQGLEEIFPGPQVISILNPRIVNKSVYSQMAMACHDYTNKLSYRLVSSSEKLELKSQIGSSQKPMSIKPNTPAMTKKSCKSRSNSAGLTGRKGKVAEDGDYLAHGTGIPRYDTRSSSWMSSLR